MSPQESKAFPAALVTFLWWIGAAALCLLLQLVAAPGESRALARTVNAAFEAARDSRRVDAVISPVGPDGAAALFGTRYAIKGKKEVAIVFSIMASGASASFVAVYAGDRGIVSVLPLDPDSKIAVPRLPRGLLETFVDRIERSEELVAQRKTKK